MDLIGRKAFAKELGVEESIVRNWQKLYWERGVHYVVVGKTTLVKRGATTEWLNNGCRKDSPSEETQSESRSWSEGKSTQKPSKAPVTKLTSPLA